MPSKTNTLNLSFIENTTKKSRVNSGKLIGNMKYKKKPLFNIEMPDFGLTGF